MRTRGLDVTVPECWRHEHHGHDVVALDFENGLVFESKSQLLRV